MTLMAQQEEIHIYRLLAGKGRIVVGTGGEHPGSS